MNLSSNGADLIKAFEGCRLAAYTCPANVLTIGWGHTNAARGPKFKAGDIWTQKQCDDAFNIDMGPYEEAVEALVHVQLAQHQFDALVSFAYNCGRENLRSSTLLRKLNAGDFEGAAKEFPKWCRGNGVVLKGLVRRRAAEEAMFRGDAA